MDAHYLHPVLGVRRWTSQSRALYAVDLTFEIDAHVNYPKEWRLCHEDYDPIIKTAVAIGRTVYDHLIEEVRVDPRYITTSVTRMGARLDVDWRAFGPRKAWMVAAVVRDVERKLFPKGLEEHEGRLREAIEERRKAHDATGDIKVHVELDTRMFEGSDRTRLDGASRGGTLRAIGALHSASSDRVMWIRATPVPHDVFRSENARQLTRASRNHNGPSARHFELPGLFASKWLARQPAYRHPQGDAIIESSPNPCVGLMALFDRAHELVDELALTSLSEARERATLRSAYDPGPVGYEVTPEIVRAVAQHVDGGAVDRGSHFRLVCPQCGDQRRSAKLFLDSGSFQCFRCYAKPIGLVQVAKLANCVNLVPVRRHSTKTVRRVRLVECDDGVEETPWEADRVEAPDCTNVEEARVAQRAFLDDALARRDEWDLVVLRSPTGTGKTTVTEDAVASSGLLSRGFYARAEGRARYLNVMQPSRAIDGRQPGVNCDNPRIARAMTLGVPTHEICGPQCPQRSGCSYMDQFDGIEGHHLALLHAHLPHSGMKKFGGGGELHTSDAEIALIDENSWSACFEVVDLTPDDLDLMRTTATWSDPDHAGFIDFLSERGLAEVVGSCLDDLRGDLDPDSTVTMWSAMTRDIETIISSVMRLLQPEAIVEAQRRTVGLRPKTRDRQDETTVFNVLADAELRVVLETDGPLRDALGRLDAATLAAWAAEARDLFLLEAPGPKDVFRPAPKMALGLLVEGLRAILFSHDAVAPLHVVHDARADRWVVRLTRRREPWPGQAILCSATITPLQAQLAFTSKRTWVFAPNINERERRFLVADRSYSQQQLKDPKEWDRVVETVRSLVERERDRTGMPVAVIGNSKVINRFLDGLLPGGLPKHLKMPWARGRRDENFEELRSLCESLGVLPGYAGGVSGSNAFVANPGAVGGPRFVRSLIVLGNILPRLADVASELRGVFAAGGLHKEAIDLEGFDRWRQAPVDWTVVRRFAAVPGTQRGEGSNMTVQAITNMMGFADPRAQDLLYAAYGAELVQIVGRLRGVIPDPEGVEARAYILAGMAVPGFEIDAVTSLEELRGELGLSVKVDTLRKKALDVDKIAKAVKLRGTGEVLRRLACAFLAKGVRHGGAGPKASAVALAEAALARAGYLVTEEHRARAVAAIEDRQPGPARVRVRDLDELLAG